MNRFCVFTFIKSVLANQDARFQIFLKSFLVFVKVLILKVYLYVVAMEKYLRYPTLIYCRTRFGL